MEQNFTVAMSVYKNDNPQHFKTAVHSIYDKQTIRPSEIVLVKDGPVPSELEHAISEICREIPIVKVVAFDVNKGHAAARQGGLDNATNELVAIMDSDDIAEPFRFEQQLAYMSENPDITVTGSNIKEFVGEQDNIVGLRLVPESDVEIKEYLKSRCPMNLMTVMYRKSKVMEVGGFIDWFCEEDYYLWIRLALAGHKFHNHQKSFVNVRVGQEMYQRRGGWKYFKSEASLQYYMLNHKLIGLGRYLYNVAVRFAVQVVMPNRVRGWLFQKFARKQL